MTAGPGRAVAWLIIAIACLLAGCANRPHPPASRTTVVLLPDDDGKVGAVSVSAASGVQLLGQARSHTIVNGVQAQPSPATVMTPEALRRDYGELLRIQAPKPRTFMLHFLLDKAELTGESRAMLPALFAAAGERKPASIMVFGHADATGSPQRNMKLSADRAEAVANLLRRNDPGLEDIEVQYFGETRPLTQSGPGVAEARNRRVEVLIL